MTTDEPTEPDKDTELFVRIACWIDSIPPGVLEQGQEAFEAWARAHPGPGAKNSTSSPAEADQAARTLSPSRPEGKTSPTSPAP